MPEGPELYLASVFINKVCKGRIFTGGVTKSAVSIKNPDIAWAKDEYTICATSRGKEVKLMLSDLNQDSPRPESKMYILIRFGMSGKFSFDQVDAMHKHAHLNFFTKSGGQVLSFVDMRRFGKWEVNEDWGKDRGPCVLQQATLFR